MQANQSGIRLSLDVNHSFDTTVAQAVHTAYIYYTVLDCKLLVIADLLAVCLLAPVPPACSGNHPHIYRPFGMTELAPPNVPNVLLICKNPAVAHFAK